MQGKKEFRKIRQLMCLLLAAVLICSTVPIDLTYALENEAAQGTEELSEVGGADSGTQAGGEKQEVAVEAEIESVSEPGSESSEETEPESESNAETTTYANSISGMLWLDIFDDIDNGIYAGDAIRQAEEQPLAGYTVSLYKADDTSNAVQMTTTDAEGKYEFANLDPDTYVVGVATSTINEIEYLLPFWYLKGTEGDNRFVTTYDAAAEAYLNAYTDSIVVEADSVIADMDAGMRTVPEKMTMDYTLTERYVTYGGVSLGSNTSRTVANDGDVYSASTISGAPAGYVCIGYYIGSTYTAASATIFTGSNDNITYNAAGGTTIFYIYESFEINVSTAANGGTANGTYYGYTTAAALITFNTIANNNTIAGVTYSYKITQSTASTTRRIVVNTGVTTDITLSGINIPNAVSPFQLSGNANVTLTLADSTTNTLRCTGTSTTAGTIQAGIYVALNATLTIRGDGTLTAAGGYGGAGIGGIYSSSGISNGTVIVESGTVIATGGTGGAGIGGGGTSSLASAIGGTGGVITIYNGTITATGGNGGAGIGGGGSQTTSSSAGSGGIITIYDGTITATGVGGAGIGGGANSRSAGDVTIYDGIVDAIGGYGAAGIGGGSCHSAGSVSSNITIYDGTITATGGVGGAGIGGGWYVSSGVVNIYGGEIIATGGQYGSGIGGGSDGVGGIVTITGGTIEATGGDHAAGIGGGGDGDNLTGSGGAGGTVNISGADTIVKAIGGTPYGSIYPAGIGGGIGYATTGTNVFTSGSIYPVNAAGTVSVATNTTNGSSNGNVRVYMTAVTVQEIGGTLVTDAYVTINNNRTSGYNYEAYTNTVVSSTNPKAYVWVPLQTYGGGTSTLFEADKDGYYGSETGTVNSNNTLAVTIILGMRTTISKEPTGIAFITATDTEPVTVKVKAENGDTGALKDIVGAEWFRIETTDTTTYTKADFSTGYAAAASGDSGAMTGTGTLSEMNYELPVSENGTYWVMVHYLNGAGNDVYQVKSIMVDNVYTQVTGKWKGINTMDSSTIYDETLPDSLIKELVGVAFELNSTTNILYSTVDGTTAEPGTDAQISVSAKNLGSLWTVTSTNPLTANVTGTDLGTFEFQYALDPSAITIIFDPQGGTPTTIADQYYMPTDNFILPLPTVSQANFNLEGWFDASTGGNLINPVSTDTVGTYLSAAPGSTVTLYAQWTPDAHTVTEKYVDANGNSITDSSSVAIADTTQLINSGSGYSGNGNTTATQGYVYIGYKIGNDTDTFATAGNAVYGSANPTIASVTADQTVFFIYTKASIAIEKLADNGSAQPGVTFKLEKMDASGTTVDTSVTYPDIITDGNGEAKFENLAEGIYQITEVSGPSGYSTLTEPIRVDMPYSSTAAPTGAYTYKTEISGTDTYFYYHLTYTITNQAELQMPTAGSSFLSQYYLWIGLGMFFAAGVTGLYRQKRRRLYKKQG